MGNKELDKEVDRTFFNSKYEETANENFTSEKSSDKTVANENKINVEQIIDDKSIDNEYSQSENSVADSESSLDKQSKDKKSVNIVNQSRVIRTLDRDKIQQSDDNRAKQKRVLENAMRKSMSLSIIISALLAALIYFSFISFNYYGKLNEERKSARVTYVDLFQRLGLRSKDATVESSYRSNKEKIEKQYQLSKEKDVKVSQGEESSSDSKNSDSKVLAVNSSDNVNTSSMNIANKLDLRSVAGKGPIDYQSAKLLFKDTQYKDVEEMLGSKDTLVNLERVDGGYIQHFPYLNIFAAGEYPLLPKSQELANAYFDNACFIGDSIMSIFAAGASYEADFFAKPLMNTVNALDEFEFTNKEGKTGTVRELLKEKKYDKVYILLGTNDAAFGDENDYKERYRKVLDYVRLCQSDAEIYILALFPISAYYEEEGRYPTNEYFARSNKALLELCQESGNFFLDYGSYMRAAYGVLPDEAAHDGIHFTIEYVPAWEEYISTHTWDGALALIDPSIKLQTKESIHAEKLSIEQALPDLNENLDNQGKDQNNDQEDLKDENTDIDKSIIENKEKSIKNNELAIAEGNQNIPSVERMSSVYEVAFANTDPDIKERLDSLYRDIIDKISFDDKMSSIRIKNIPSFYGLDLNSITDARILRGSGATAEELLIFRFNSEDEAMDARQTLVNYRQKRIESYSDYVPSEVPRLEKTRIVRNGKYLFFVVATDSNLLESIVDKY